MHAASFAVTLSTQLRGWSAQATLSEIQPNGSNFRRPCDTQSILRVVVSWQGEHVDEAHLEQVHADQWKPGSTAQASALLSHTCSPGDAPQKRRDHQEPMGGSSVFDPDAHGHRRVPKE